MPDDVGHAVPSATGALSWAPTDPGAQEAVPQGAAPQEDERLRADFRRAVGRFATGVTVVSTCPRGVDHAMTANAFTSVSLDPPLVLVCVETQARFHDAVLESGRWAVSILSAQGRPAASWLATRGRPVVGQLDGVPHRRGEYSGAALVDAAVAWLECRTQAVHPAGDHSIVVGEVVRAELGGPGERVLVYHTSAYRELG